MRLPAFTVLSLSILVLLLGCSEPQQSSDAAPPEPVEAVLAGQLLAVKQTQAPTNVLSEHPEMARSTAYAVQLQALRAETEGADYYIGWKMGGTRVVDASVSPDPSFAYILRSDSLEAGAQVSSSQYVDGDVLVEAEIAFVMGADLEDEEHTRAQVMAAIREVAGAIELIDVRVIPGEEGVEPTMNHMIAANLSHAGVMLTSERKALDEVDLIAELATVFVDGEEQASGEGKQIMGSNPLDALFWLANALPEHGLHLRAGDVVITGSLYDNPTLVSGSTAEVRFSSFGSISVSMDE